MRAALIVIACTLMTSPVRAGPFERAQRGHARVRQAFESHLAEVESDFAAAGAAWPPRGVYLRAFKHEGVIELWAEPAGAPERVLVRSFLVCAKSGGLGPKRKEGDQQVPEGFYTIDRFNPRSSYHLSLGIDYPNAVDKARAGDDPPGGDIFIHGNCVTIGCLPIEDGPIEALYVVAVRARDRGQKQIPVHILPCRFGTEGCGQAIGGGAPDPEVAALWALLALAQTEFDTTHVPPRYVAKASGYVRVGP